MKKILIGLLAFVVVFSLTGCGAREKLEKKAEEEFTEKILEEAGAGDVDVDGEKITIKGESGEEVTFGGWRMAYVGAGEKYSGLNDVGIGVSIVYADEVMTITVFASQQE